MQSLLSTSVISTAALVLTILILAVYGVWTKIKEAKKNAKAAAELEENKIQERIKHAVNNERQSATFSRAVDDERLTRLQQIGTEWKDLAEQRKNRNDMLQSELASLHEELKDLRSKYDDILKLYTESQKELSELRRLIGEKNTGRLREGS